MSANGQGRLVSGLTVHGCSLFYLLLRKRMSREGYQHCQQAVRNGRTPYGEMIIFRDCRRHASGMEWEPAPLLVVLPSGVRLVFANCVLVGSHFGIETAQLVRGGTSPNSFALNQFAPYPSIQSTAPMASL